MTPISGCCLEGILDGVDVAERHLHAVLPVSWNSPR
jgi:hypothetical protein